MPVLDVPVLDVPGSGTDSGTQRFSTPLSGRRTMNAGLLEAVAAMAIEALVLSASLAGIIANSQLLSAAALLHSDILQWRRVEHLFDTTLRRAGYGPNAPPPIAEASAARIVVQSDHDGDGRIDPRSSEITIFYFSDKDGGRSLMHRMGRQSMTLISGLSDRSVFRIFDGRGTAAGSPGQARLLEIDCRSANEIRTLLRMALPEAAP